MLINKEPKMLLMLTGTPAATPKASTMGILMGTPVVHCRIPYKHLKKDKHAQKGKT